MAQISAKKPEAKSIIRSKMQCDADHPWWLVPLAQGVGQVVTWLFIGIGWCVVNSQNNSRERRKEARSAVDKLSERIESLERKSISFHTEKYNHETANEILSEITRISEGVRRTKLLSDVLQKSLTIHLRKSITLDNFDKSAHEIKSQNDPLIRDISVASGCLISALEEGFFDRFA